MRPFAYTASVLTVALGAAMTHGAGYPIRWGLLACTLLGVLAFHAAANLLNDCFDKQRGLDRQVLPVSGAVVRGWITVRQAFRAAMLCLIVGILHANNWRDIATDGTQGCRTIAGLLGPERSRRYYQGLVLVPFALVALYAALGQVPRLHLPTPTLALLAFLAFPLALRLARTRPQQDAMAFAMLDAKTAQLHLLFGVLCSAAFWLG